MMEQKKEKSVSEKRRKLRKKERKQLAQTAFHKGKG